MGAAGVGTCSSESPTFSKGSGDCLGLISTGTSPFNSKLLGVSLNGTDAYFFTRDSLAPQDENGELVKIYDARENGGFFVTPEPPLCKSSDECHGAGSSAAAAAGLPPQHRHRRQRSRQPTKMQTGFVRKHGKCVKQAPQPPQAPQQARAKTEPEARRQEVIGLGEASP